MIATCSVVIEADAIAENITSSRPESKKLLMDMKRFENDVGNFLRSFFQRLNKNIFISSTEWMSFRI